MTESSPSLIGSAIWRASPSLALIKYWGKSSVAANLPATPSLAITLDSLASETRVFAIESDPKQALDDVVVLDGEAQPAERFGDFFAALRAKLGQNLHFWAESANNFPTAAGLASSSSGFAALSLACAHAAAVSPPSPQTLSALARLGSGSAARSLFGGFTLLPAQAESAQSLYPANFWPELRLVIVRIDSGKKAVSSRQAMEITRQTSPYYPAWLTDAPLICQTAQAALAHRDLTSLGQAMRQSYLRMFSTMFSANPPIIYWQDRSLKVIKICEALRQSGVGAWETMDAGPQVKILCLDTDLPAIQNALAGFDIAVDRVGEGPRSLGAPQILATPHPLIRELADRHGLTLPGVAG